MKTFYRCVRRATRASHPSCSQTCIDSGAEHHATHATTSSLRMCAFRFARLSLRGSQRGRAVSHPLTQLHRKLRVVEHADPPDVEEPRHSLRIADPNNVPVITTRLCTTFLYPLVIALRPVIASCRPCQMTLCAGEATPDLLVPALPA